MWDLRRLQTEMRRVGWKRIPGPVPSVYEFIHRNGERSEIHLRTFYGEDTKRAQAFGRSCFEWETWAAVEMTPPPF